MADKSAKVPDNVNGKFFVDENCIACDACIFAAEKFFKMNDEQGYAFVFRQPTTSEETEECQTALEGCPVGSIGNDGE